MRSTATTPEAYIAELPEERRAAVKKLRSVIKKNLPKGFKEVMGYGMIGYVVPHTRYPMGYHCDTKQPLPFMNLASQKNYIALHHMGLYSVREHLDWFVKEFPKHTKLKLDMGKGCIRFKNVDDIPFDLIGELAARVTVDEWIECYDKLKKSK